MLWLAAGLLAQEAYVYGGALIAGDAAMQPRPAPFYIPVAVALAVLLLTARRFWWLLLGEYCLALVAHTLAVRGTMTWPLALAVAGAVLDPLIGALLLGRLTGVPPRFDS